MVTGRLGCEMVAFQEVQRSINDGLQRSGCGSPLQIPEAPAAARLGCKHASILSLASSLAGINS